MQPAFFFYAVIIGATFLCALVAGFLFSFAVVVMPGIRALDDRGFILAFQTMDRVIQNNQPLFIIVWAGSILFILGAAVLGIWSLGGVPRVLLIAAATVFLFGVHVPTVVINLPLNRGLQALTVDTLREGEVGEARENFETRWNQANVVRTAISCITLVLLLLVIISL